MGLIITFLLGIFFLFGIGVIKIAKNANWIEQLSIAIAFGAMVGLTLLDLIPEICEDFAKNHSITAIIAVIGGILFLECLDYFIPDHDGDPHESHHDHHDSMVHIGIISAIAIILHNLVEGMTVYSLALESARQGIILSLGVGLHNIPMGMLISTTLDGETKHKKIIMITLASISTFLGGVLMALINPVLTDYIIGILICLALGMILYIVLFELVPYLMRHKNRGLSVIGILIGLAVLFGSTFLE